MKNFKLSYCITVLVLLFFIQTMDAQIYPVSFDSRISDSPTAVLGTVAEKIPYKDIAGKNIYTLHIIEVNAFVKGYKNDVQRIGLILEGGILENEMEVTFPSVKLTEGEEVLVMLSPDEKSVDNRGYRTLYPEIQQSRPAFGVQGVLKYKNGNYIDRVAESPMTEEVLLSRIENISMESARRPDGTVFEARPLKPQSAPLKVVLGLNDGAGSNPTSFVSGTIEADNELVITGSGFGTSIGTVNFSDADAGGGDDFVVPLNSIDSDIVSWSDTKIRLKIPTEAGSGDIDVEDASGTTVGSAEITIDYGINNISSNFYNWPTENRNRLELVNMDGLGGYTFEYNNNAPDAMNSFHANTAARDAFERAIDTWRCNTGVNFDVDNSGTTAGHAGDNGNIIIFQNLSGGTLGVTTSRYSALANGACSMENTLWYLEEIDIRFNTSFMGSFSWNYGPGGAAGNQFDFESTAVHELGHAHGLGHIISPGKVMHYSLQNGAEIRDLSPEDIAAGSFKVAHSIQSNCITSPGPMTDVDINDCSILPVEIIDFSAIPENSGVNLNWVTVREVNNNYFTIERSKDGKLFQELTKVLAVGYSEVPTDYNYLDEKPFSGTSYYRLKQTDFDGNFTYSDVKVVDYHIPDHSVRIIPNPVSGNELDILFEVNSDDYPIIVLTDISGRELNVPLEMKSNGVQVDVSFLTPGIYFVTVNPGSGRVEVQKFVKQ